MNELFFRCETCKRFVDAGYRWAYWNLVKPGVVQADDYDDGGNRLPFVSVEAVLAAEAYWQGAAEDAGLAVQLNRVRAFLADHRVHRLSFGDIHRLHYPADEWLSWMCDDPDGDVLPRHFTQVLGFTAWAQVEAHVRTLRRPPWWWSSPETRVAARRKFEELAQGVRHSQMHDAVEQGVEADEA